MLLFFSPLAEQAISFIAGLCIVIAQLTLLKDVYKRNISPGILSWLGWALLMGTSLIAQILHGGWRWSLLGLTLSTCGCLIIFFTALLLKNYLLKKTDSYFLLLGLLCMVIYITSNNAWLTTVFAVLADFIVGIPTLQHAYRNPETQKTHAWSLAFVSWLFTLMLCIGHSWLYALFPVYLFIYNGVMIWLTHTVKAKNNAITND